MVNCIGISDIISLVCVGKMEVFVLTKCPDESPIVLCKRHKTTKIGVHRPVPQTKHAMEGLALGLK